MDTRIEKTDIIAQVCAALATSDRTGAQEVAQRHYPFVQTETTGRRYNALQRTQLFWHDGFVDRYSGARLVFPGMLRLLSILMPAEFPAHPNWKTNASHMVYWELFPTIEHIVPVARGGPDTPDNWVTTSMLRNSAKSNWSLEELGWALHPAGEIHEWDGLISRFLETVGSDLSLLAHSYLRRWHRAATIVSPKRKMGCDIDGIR